MSDNLTINKGGCGPAHALTLSDIRTIAREFAPFIGLMIDMPPTDDHSEHGLAVVGKRAMLGDPSFFEAVIEAGCRCERSQAEKLPMLSKTMLALQVLQLTQKAFEGRPLWPMIVSEIAPESEKLSLGAHR